MKLFLRKKERGKIRGLLSFLRVLGTSTMDSRSGRSESGIPYCHKAIHVIALLLTTTSGLKQKFDVQDLFVLEKNIHAIRFYQCHGFSLTQERQLEEGTTEYIVKMTYKRDYRLQ